MEHVYQLHFCHYTFTPTFSSQTYPHQFNPVHCIFFRSTPSTAQSPKYRPGALLIIFFLGGVCVTGRWLVPLDVVGCPSVRVQAAIPRHPAVREGGGGLLGLVGCCWFSLGGFAGWTTMSDDHVFVGLDVDDAVPTTLDAGQGFKLNRCHLPDQSRRKPAPPPNQPPPPPLRPAPSPAPLVLLCLHFGCVVNPESSS